jgi:hypothetical protein
MTDNSSTVVAVVSIESIATHNNLSSGISKENESIVNTDLSSAFTSLGISKSSSRASTTTMLHSSFLNTTIPHKDSTTQVVKEFIEVSAANNSSSKVLIEVPLISIDNRNTTALGETEEENEYIGTWILSENKVHTSK